MTIIEIREILRVLKNVFKNTILLLSVGIALSEVVSIVQEKILGDQHTSVFFLKDLRKLYQDRLKYLGANDDIIKNVNATRLNDQLLHEIPGLPVQKSGKFVILTLEEDVGKALVECSQNTWHDKGIILSKAARIVRRFLFSKEETFDGDLSIKRQKESVPLPLLNLVSVIINDKTAIDNATTNAAKVARNLAQLLRFNAVKTKRRSDGFLRHSKSNELPLPVSTGLHGSC